MMAEKVVFGASGRVEMSCRDMMRPFSGERSEVVLDQAREKGWEVQRPMEGMVRKVCWPGWKVQGRATCSVRRRASPGRASMVAVVGLEPRLR